MKCKTNIPKERRGGVERCDRFAINTVLDYSLLFCLFIQLLTVLGGVFLLFFVFIQGERKEMAL